MRVLLIEDDSAMARSIELMLRSEGLNVYTTDLGEEGIDLGKLYDYDIIVLDLQLPDMSGYEVLKALRLLLAVWPLPCDPQQALLQDRPLLRRQKGDVNCRRPRLDGDRPTTSTYKLVHAPLRVLARREA